MKKLVFIFALIVMTASLPYAAWAQDGAEPDILDLESLTTDDKYIEPTFQNLSKLYWAIGKLALEEDEMIDNYLLINECQLYLQFFHNDFEWQALREATRDYILKHMASFPTRFELMSPIYLGRYNMEKEKFEMESENQLINMRKVDFKMTAMREHCGHSGEIEGYPRNIIVILTRPFTLVEVPVERRLAEMYLDEARRFYENLPPKMQMDKYQRVAYLRLKVRISQYKNTVTNRSGDLRAVVFGQVDGYEIYADPDKMKPLYTHKFEDRFRRRRMRRHRDEEESYRQQQEAAESEGEMTEEEKENFNINEIEGLSEFSPID